MNEIIRHERKNAFTGSVESDATLEFRLPVDMAKLAEFNPPTSEWFKLICGLAPAESDVWTSKYFKPYQTGVIALAEELERYKPTSVIHYCDSWFIRCCIGDPNDYSISNELYLAHKLFWPEISVFIEDFPADQTLKEFFRQFAGMRESMPPMSGDFVYNDLQLLDDLVSGRDTDEYEDWLDALCVYHAVNGDLVLLGEDGETGWYVMAENRVDLFTSSFDEMLQLWAEFRSTWNKPFDSYSASEFLRNRNQ